MSLADSANGKPEASREASPPFAAAMRTFKFGPWPIRASEVFFASPLSFGLVNLKPIVPGHVLVISRRVVARFSDLSPDEAVDLFRSAQVISKAIEQEYKADAMSITIQDGPAAGQSVPHVHIHVIPRHTGDWMNNDDIYPEINRKEAQMGHAIYTETGDYASAAGLERRAFRPAVVSNAPHANAKDAAVTGKDGDTKTVHAKGADCHERPPRTQEDMAAESSILRKLFTKQVDIWTV